MKQLTYAKPDILEWREQQDATIVDPTDALVRPVAVSACDADPAIVAGHFPVIDPVALGHEFVADVTAVGSNIKKFNVGDRVVVPMKISCGSCSFCTRGLTAACTTAPRGTYGMGKAYGEWGGALSDLVRVPFADHMLVLLPDGVPPESAAAASDNMSDAWRAVGPLLASSPGSDVLVALAGGRAKSIALYAAGIAVALGAGKTVFLDDDNERLEIASRLGATPIEGNAPPGDIGSFPIIVDCSTQTEVLAAALRSAAPFSTCTACGVYFTDGAVPLGDMYNKGVTLVVAPTNHRIVLPSVLELLASKRFDPSPIHTVVDWDDAAKALRNPPIKLVITRR